MGKPLSDLPMAWRHNPSCAFMAAQADPFSRLVLLTRTRYMDFSSCTR